MKLFLPISIVVGVIGLVLGARILLNSDESNSPRPVDDEKTFTDGTNFDEDSRWLMSDANRIHVKLPGNPVRNSRIPYLKGSFFCALHDTPTVSYMVGAIRNRNAANGWVPEEVTRAIETETSKRVRDYVTGVEEVNYPISIAGGGIRGRYSEGVLKDGLKYRLRVFLETHKRISNYYYQLVIGRPEALQAPEVQEFFDSFRVLPPTASTGRRLKSSVPVFENFVAATEPCNVL